MSDTAIEVPATTVPPVLVTIPNIGQVLMRHWPDGSIEADYRPHIHATWLPVQLLGGAVEVVAGCWSGTLDELAERIDSPDAWDHGTAEDRDRWRRDYTAAFALFAPRVAEWAETPQPPMPETEVAS